MSAEVRDDGEALAQTSNDFRFAAAVAAFAQELKRAPMAAKMKYAEVLELAEGAVGEDPRGYRGEFLDLVRLSSEDFAKPQPAPESESESESESPQRREPSTAAPPPRKDEEDPAFVLEVLRLLPPLLAFPMFILAFRNRRRRLAA